MNDDQEPSERRGLMRRIKFWLVRPGTIKMAIAFLKLIYWIAKVLDWF